MSSDWAKRGPAGQVQKAKRSAPDDASGLQILAVAHEAHSRGVDPAIIWAEVDDNQTTLTGGEA